MPRQGRRIKHKNSKPAENLEVRYLYSMENGHCELSAWMRRYCHGGLTEQELNAPAADVHHIFHKRQRYDVWSNLITVSRPIHDWIHRNSPDGTILCLWRKIIVKDEFDHDEFKKASGMFVDGWLCCHEPQRIEIRPLWNDLTRRFP